MILSGTWAFDRWLQAERQRVRSAAIPVALALADEAVARRLMTLQARQGNRAAATATYRALVDRLTEELMGALRRSRDAASICDPSSGASAVSPHRVAPLPGILRRLDLEAGRGHDRTYAGGSLNFVAVNRELDLAPALVWVAEAIGARVPRIPPIVWLTTFVLDVETTSVASQAAVGGPSSALALAVGLECGRRCCSPAWCWTSWAMPSGTTWAWASRTGCGGSWAADGRPGKAPPVVYVIRATNRGLGPRFLLLDPSRLS